MTEIQGPSLFVAASQTGEADWCAASPVANAIRHYGPPLRSENQSSQHYCSNIGLPKRCERCDDHPGLYEVCSPDALVYEDLPRWCGDPALALLGFVQAGEGLEITEIHVDDYDGRVFGKIEEPYNGWVLIATGLGGTRDCSPVGIVVSLNASMTPSGELVVQGTNIGGEEVAKLTLSASEACEDKVTDLAAKVRKLLPKQARIVLPTGLVI